MRCVVNFGAVFICLAGIADSLCTAEEKTEEAAEASKDYVVYEGGEGIGEGKHVVLLTGDEEYRSEEALVQLAKILAFRHGFRATVLFAINPKDGTINPNVNDTLPGAEQLDSADVIVMGLRFRRYPDDVMKHFVDAYLDGKPFVGIRTSTHAFNYPADSESKYTKYSYNSEEWPGGFGQQVLGETWVGHLGTNHEEATRGIPAPEAQNHPMLRGVGQVFATSGAYKASPEPESIILMRGQVLAGMKPDSPPESDGKNQPMQPVAWTRKHRNEAGTTNHVFCTTMGAATDLLDENFRRLLVNGVLRVLDMDIPAETDVRLVGDYQPTDYRFDGFRKGVKPSDLAMTKGEVEKDE